MNKQPKQAPAVEMRPGRGPGGPMGSRMHAEKPKNSRKTIGRLFRYISKSKKTLFALLAVMLIVTACNLVGPMMQGNAIDAIEAVKVSAANGQIYRYTDAEGRVWLKRSADRTLGGADDVLLPDDPEGVEFRTVLVVHLQGESYVGRAGETRGMVFYLVLLACFYGASALFVFFQQRIAAKLSQDTVYTMRNDLFRKMTSLPVRYTDTHKHGDLMSRMTNDVENVSNAVSQSIASLISAIITIVGAFVFMLTISPILTLVAVLTIPLTILVSTGLAKFMRKYFIRQQRLLGQLNGQVEEMVTSYKTVVAYGKEATAVDQFTAVSEDLRHTSISAKVWGSIMGPIMNFLGNLQYVLIAAAGGAMFLFYRSVSIGNIQAMLQYSKNFTRPINEIANQYSSILTALAGAERIFEIMDSEPEQDTGTSDITPEQIKGNIQFENVNFGYVSGEPVLKNLNLSVGAGQKIAIVGATGSGKTTIINLLTRFYECDGGRITVDGVDIRDIPLHTLRRSIGIVLQDTVLFRDSIEKNIKYGRLDATEEEMRSAAAVSKADLFIDRLPEGYQTELAEGGSNLSQGQRQLLAITRAIIADPKILILDEATSNVDTRTEMDIQQALIRLMKNRTNLIIAHRLSTIRDADCIVVLKNGCIAESGNHETLLAAGGEYSKLYQSQFAGIAT